MSSYQAKAAHTKVFIDVILLFKSVHKERGGETLSKFMCTLFMEGLLHKFSHIQLTSD